MSPITTNTNYPGSNIGNQGGLWNWLKNLGSSGSQFSISPTITNEQVGNSVQQIQNFGLPTAITPSPISPYGINSMIKKGEIDNVINQTTPGTAIDFSDINKGGITWEDMYGSGKDGETSQFNVVKRKQVTPENKEKEKKPELTDREKEELEYEFWKKKVGDLEGVGERGADKQALRKGIFGVSSNWQSGLDNAADIHRQGLASFATIASNLPKYNLPTMSMRTPSFKYF